MAHYLVYWRVFWVEAGDRLQAFLETNVRHDWYTDNKRFYDKVERGDSLWAVISGGPHHPNEWRLLHHVIVLRRDPNKYNLPFYGQYRIIGDGRQSVLYHPDAQKDFTPILHTLTFKTGKKILFSGRRIGLALQSGGHRQLSDTDAKILEAYASTLRRVRI